MPRTASRHSLAASKESPNGKAKPFRTSGGRAATTSLSSVATSMLIFYSVAVAASYFLEFDKLPQFTINLFRAFFGGLKPARRVNQVIGIALLLFLRQLRLDPFLSFLAR